MGRSFVISDIHGCCKTFIALVEEVLKLQKEDSIYLLGDYIDRGMDSKGVIDYIFKLREEGFQVYTSMGNHEEIALKAFDEKESLDMWLNNGGDKTLKSFGVEEVSDIPSKYIDFLKSLEYFFLLDNYILVHAGINFNAPNFLEDKEAMLWLRKFTVDPEVSGGRVVVHGHTPVSLMDIQESIVNVNKDFKINIDNGCVFKKNEFFGHLCCLELYTNRVFLKANIDN